MKRVSLLCFAWMAFFCASYAQTFRVSGSSLRDANNNNFVIRGINVPLQWFYNDVHSNIANIRSKTNANLLRLVWSSNASYADSYWQSSVQRCIDNKMIPMMELHDATGSNDPQRLRDMANWYAARASYFRQTNIAKHVLINIANEWSDWYMASPTNAPDITVWRDAYKSAITIIRNAGITSTLVIDGAGYGQDIAASLRTYGQELLNYDPQHNLLFSVHMYCEWTSVAKMESELQSMKNANLPIIVGEFGNNHPPCGNLPYTDLMRICQQKGIGYIPWSWKGNTTGTLDQLDMSSDWAGNSLTPWGNGVVNGANGIKSTSSVASVFGSTPPPTSGPANGVYQITARHSGKALDVASNSLADGANVQQYTYSGGSNQKWTVTSLGSGQYSIRALHSGKALDVTSSSLSDGADINQWAYSGGNNQKWRIESVGSGYYRIVSVNSGKCVDVVGASTANGAAINQYTCNGGNNQSFQLTYLSGGRLAAEHNPEDTPATVYPNPAQSTFTLEKAGTFDYSIYNVLGTSLESGQTINKVTTGQSLKPGLYLIRVKSLQGNQTLKLVKE
ncbi:RICIN domain-containing protein [Spirosoma soli]|uniref:RICIN domain-containing protein n=1 Tax=Spirosoma soli TaxID=1770529 RepID=A0ABW5M7Y8_9BACT